MSFELSLALLFHFAWFVAFHAICWLCDFFLLLDDLLEFFFVFWSSSSASCVLIGNSNFVILCYQCTHQGED
jgi:hypothetical protein